MKILYLLFLMIFIYSGAYSQEDSIKKLFGYQDNNKHRWKKIRYQRGGV